MGALTSLNISDNDIGALAPVEGWKSKDNDGMAPWIGPDGRKQDEEPPKEPQGVIALANAISNMGALSSLDLAENSLGELVLPAGWEKAAWKEEWTHFDGAKVKDNPGKPKGIIAIATAIPDMEVLTKLDISKNALCAAGAKHLADALNGNEVMTELNVSSNFLGQVTSAWDAEPDISGVAALAGVLPGMGSLTKLNISSNNIRGRVLGLTNLLTEMADGHQPFIELDLSGNSLIPGETNTL
jgi:Ran GTPase-activating protein (RanGAP) involved in mRNA processing and transport